MAIMTTSVTASVATCIKKRDHQSDLVILNTEMELTLNVWFWTVEMVFELISSEMSNLEKAKSDLLLQMIVCE